MENVDTYIVSCLVSDADGERSHVSIKINTLSPYCARMDAIRLLEQQDGIARVVNTLEVRNQVIRTHDGRLVHPAGSALPEGARGWTQCRVGGGAYSTWLLEADRERSAADLARITAEVNAMRTKAQAIEAIGADGGCAYAQQRLADMKTALIIRRYAKEWPLIESI